MCKRIPQGRWLSCSTRNRRDKAVAATRHIGHISSTRSPFTERLAQRRNVIAKVALIDHKVRPHSCEQLLLADHFGRAFDESDKNVESAAAKLNRAAAFFQESLRGG